jgi:hypothetical protein
MSIFSDCRVVVLLADYAVADSAGKLNILGTGFTITAVQPATGLTAAMYVVIMMDVPSKYVGQDFPVGVELQDDTTGQTVVVAGPTGSPDALRVQQLVKADPPHVAGVYLPPSLWSRVQLVMGFPNGLPLKPGGFYKWRVEVETQHRPGWSAHFHVAGPPPPPVFGGPTGSPAIEDVPPVDE